jgi:hypothetical protein
MDRTGISINNKTSRIIYFLDRYYKFSLNTVYANSYFFVKLRSVVNVGNTFVIAASLKLV